MIDIENLTKVYRMGEMEVQALGGVTLSVNQGEWIASDEMNEPGIPVTWNVQEPAYMEARR